MKHLKDIYDSMNEKQKKTIRFIPSVALYMIIIVYLSGFQQTTTDLIFFIIIACVLAFLLFFLPRDSLFKNN